MKIKLALLSLVLAVAVSALAVRLLMRYLAGLAMDMPNARSLHAQPIPRTGGLGVLLGVACGWLVAGMGLPPALWFGALLLAGVSFADDRLDLPAATRFVVHFLVAAWLVWSLGIVGGWALAAVLATVWMTNLYNFMDGADGLAGGMAVFGFSAYAWALASAGQSHLAVLAAAIPAAAFGFLLFNFPPARVFMGDAGSIPLGYLAAGFGLLGVIKGFWSVWFPVLVFAPFVLDATVTLLRRALRGEKFWRAHREHNYQRLIQMGWSHRKMALTAYGLMATSALIGLAWRADARFGWMAALWLLALAGGMVLVERRWRMREKYA